ncbi:phosphotransferase family enzyme [Georgenia soli]|uniref:Phosphotransferase family enzyme n=1 Tax=Georgenia soli TaxID=638953 RepID=A0A2A9ENV5_9MICO|nr:phosphotransferase family enzyme [Georgenia soli]
MVRSALALAALATTAVPGLDVVATRPPQTANSDYQTTGLLDAGGRHWVIRAPLHPAAGAALEGEVALLANLTKEVDEGRLPFDVPRPVGFAALPEGGRAMVFRALVGRPLVLDRLTSGPGLSAELGRAIAAFHELDISVVADAGLPVYDPDSYRRRCLAEVDEAARTGRVPSVLLNRWEHALEDVALWKFRPTPVHGDLAPEHVLVKDGRITAVLSLSEVHVGDPAEDLAWLLAAAPEDSLDAIEEAYSLARTEGADATLLNRALLVSELALARWLLHGVRHDEQPVIEDATAMLRTLAADVSDAPGIGSREPVVVPDYDAGWSDEDVDDTGRLHDTVRVDETRGVDETEGVASADVVPLDDEGRGDDEDEDVDDETPAAAGVPGPERGLAGAGRAADSPGHPDHLDDADRGRSADQSGSVEGHAEGGVTAAGQRPDAGAVTEELNLGSNLPDFLREDEDRRSS